MGPLVPGEVRQSTRGALVVQGALAGGHAGRGEWEDSGEWEGPFYEGLHEPV